MKKQKGFTLIELIVVIAIIGILLAVLVPTWSYFIMKANLKTQNNYSKMIFNAAQTQATRYEVREKRTFSDATASGASDAEKNAAKSELYLASELNTSTGDFEYTIYWDGSAAHRLDSAGKIDDSADTNPQATAAFANSINKVFGESKVTVYKVYIRNYQVQSVCSARSANNDTIGSFPVIQDGRSDDTVLDFDMTTIDLP